MLNAFTSNEKAITELIGSHLALGRWDEWGLASAKRLNMAKTLGKTCNGFSSEELMVS